MSAGLLEIVGLPRPVPEKSDSLLKGPLSKDRDPSGLYSPHSQYLRWWQKKMQRYHHQNCHTHFRCKSCDLQPIMRCFEMKLVHNAQTSMTITPKLLTHGIYLTTTENNTALSRIGCYAALLLQIAQKIVLTIFNNNTKMHIHKKILNSENTFKS